jgi:NDP-hexose-3-ketoreductase
MLRFGLIACSSIARRRFVPALKNSGAAVLEHVGSRDTQKAAEFARVQGAKKSGTYDEVLQDAGVDAVYISTPISQHAEWIRRAAAAGKHVLCEKPLCPSFAEAKALVEFCREKKVRLLEAYSFRFHPQHALARQIITENRIGTPLFFNGEFTFPKPPAGNIRLNPKTNGGVFHDALGYPVAAAMMMFAAVPATVSCQMEMDSPHGVDRAASLRLTFPGGGIAHCFVGFGLHYRSHYAVTGTSGRIEAERAYAVLPDKSTALQLEQDKNVERIEVPPVDQFVLMIEEFAGQISGARPRTDWENELLRQALVKDCALRSAHEGRTISVPPL